MNGILLATNDKGLLHEVKKFLSKNFDMKDMCNASYVISIKIFRDKHKGILDMSHETYINKVLERFQMKNYSPNVAPIVKGDEFNLYQCRVAKKALRYLQRMNDYMLMYKKMDNLEVNDYSDLDFAGCNDSYKSTSGCIFMFASRVVPSRSVKHTLIATSTMEVEFVSCFETTSYNVWMRSFIYGLKIVDSISRPLRIFCINSATIFWLRTTKVVVELSITALNT